MSILGKTSKFYVDAPYNGYDIKGLSFVVQDNASNDRFISDRDLDLSFDLPDDPQHAKSTSLFSFSHLNVIIAFVSIFGSFGYFYHHQPTESHSVLKNILQSLNISNVSTELKQTRNSIMHTVNNIFQRHQLSNSSADLKQSLQTLQNESISTGLEKIGNRLILTNHWRTEDIDKFSALWDLSNEKLRIETTQSIWYQQFSFKLERQSNKLLIANVKNAPIVVLAHKLDLANLISINVSRPANRSVDTDSKRTRASSDLLTSTELQTNVSQFLKAYDSGNIKSLDILFSKNIISNKGTTRAEIRKDFIDLFSSSNERTMNIQDIHWKYFKDYAKGVGTMRTVIVANNKQVKTTKGKIQFVMKKVNNKVLITHLYQLIQN